MKTVTPSLYMKSIVAIASILVLFTTTLSAADFAIFGGSGGGGGGNNNAGGGAESVLSAIGGKGGGASTNGGGGGGEAGYIDGTAGADQYGGGSGGNSTSYLSGKGGGTTGGTSVVHPSGGAGRDGTEYGGGSGGISTNSPGGNSGSQGGGGGGGGVGSMGIFSSPWAGGASQAVFERTLLYQEYDSVAIEGGNGGGGGDLRMNVPAGSGGDGGGVKAIASQSLLVTGNLIILAGKGGNGGDYLDGGGGGGYSGNGGKAGGAELDASGQVVEVRGTFSMTSGVNGINGIDYRADQSGNPGIGGTGGNAVFTAGTLAAPTIKLTKKDGGLTFTAGTLNVDRDTAFSMDKGTAGGTFAVSVNGLAFSGGKTLAFTGTQGTEAFTAFGGNLSVTGGGNSISATNIATTAFNASGAGKSLTFDLTGLEESSAALSVSGLNLTVDADTALNLSGASNVGLGKRANLISGTSSISGTLAAGQLGEQTVDEGGGVSKTYLFTQSADLLSGFVKNITTTGDYSVTGPYSATAGSGAGESVTLDVGGTLTVEGDGALSMASSAANSATLKAGTLVASALNLIDANDNLLADIGVLDTSAGDMTINLTDTTAGDGTSGVRFSGFTFGAGKKLTIQGGGDSTRKGPITVLGAGASYSGPSIDASGQNLAFELSTNIAGGSVMLTTNNPIDVDGSTVIVNNPERLTNLRPNETIYFITNTTGDIAGNNSTMEIKTLLFDYGILISSDSNQLTGQCKTQTASKSSKVFAEGYLGKSIMLNLGGDLVAGEALRQARDIGVNVYGWTPFSAVSGEHMRYNTGSHVDVDGFSYLAGLSWSNLSRGGMFTFGAFFEGGHGNYDTHNSFSSLPSTKGDGDTDYYGGGILARLDHPCGVYAEASARVGRVESEFGSRDLTNLFGQNASYKSGTAYYGAHFGLGYVFTVAEKVGIDLSSRYLWTRQAKDNMDIAGMPVDFRAVDSHRWRNGVRVSYAASKCLSPYAGVAFEYEFDGKAKSRAMGVDLSAPALRGGSGIGEIGVTYRRPDGRGLVVDAGIQGYVGKREGVAGRIQVGWRF